MTIYADACKFKNHIRNCVKKGEIMEYGNLKAEMTRRHILINELSRVTGKSRSAVSKNLNGFGSFTVDEAMAIRDAFFPEVSIDYLFTRTSKERKYVTA